jgi:hypothetical protein
LCVAFDFGHLPTEHDLDTSLLAFIKCNFIGIVELINLLVRGPVLNTTAWCCTALQLVSAKEMLIIKSVEVRALTLVGECW